MNTDKNFKMRKTTKKILTNLFGEERNLFRSLMIDAQLSYEKQQRAPVKRDKKDAE
jgi:hypothetical protein